MLTLPHGLALNEEQLQCWLVGVDCAYQSIALMQSDTAIVGGRGGLAVVDLKQGRELGRSDKPALEVFAGKDGVGWAAIDKQGRATLLRWPPAAPHPEDVDPPSREADEARDFSRPAIRLEQIDAPPDSDKSLLSWARDGAYEWWALDASSRQLWHRGQGRWKAELKVPAELGGDLEIAADPTASGVVVLSARAVARVLPDRPLTVCYRFPESIPPAWLIASLVIAPAMLVAAAVIVTLVAAYRIRGRRDWSVIEALIALVLFAAGQMIGTIPSFLLHGPSVDVPALSISFLVGAALAIGFLYWRLRARGWGFAQLGLQPPVRWIHLAGAIAVVLAMLPLNALIHWCGQTWGWKSFLYEQSSIAELQVESWSQRLLLVLLTVVAAPLVEEILFRGFGLQAVRARFGPVAAVIFPSLMFGALHLEGVLTTALLGMALALLTIRSRSLWPAVMAHAINNGIAVLLLLSGAFQS